MILLEQKYTNLNRLYYRGLQRLSAKEKRFNETYFSTKVEYALVYTDKLVGSLGIYRLKETANIFNMKSKTDEGKLRTYCQKNLPSLLGSLEQLKNNDWLYLVGSSNRECLVNAIKALDYDGYFNYEIDKELYNNAKNNPGLCFTNLQVKSPSIAIFNPEKTLIKIKEYSGKELFNLPQVQEFKKDEKNYIVNFVKENSNKSEEQLFHILNKRIVSLTNSELYLTIKNALIPKNIRDQKELEKKAVKFLRERLNR